jgi:hypothetical protein
VRGAPVPDADIVFSVTTLEPLARRCLRASVLLSVPVAGLLAAPAHADVPLGWSEPDDVDTLGALLLLAGVPLLLFVLITLAVYLPAIVRGEKLTPDHDGPDAHWFGGPRPGAKELGHGAESSETGGARGRW